MCLGHTGAALPAVTLRHRIQAPRVFLPERQQSREMAMASDHQRWKTLRQLDQWLDAPMMVLSALWVVIVLAELTMGSSALLTTLEKSVVVL